jgi:hypothetical protein
MVEMAKPTLEGEAVSTRKEITIDLNKLTIGEYRELFNPLQTKEEESRILANVFGLTIEEYQKLPLLEWKRLTKEFFQRAREPLADPNSQSESTSA